VDALGADREMIRDAVQLRSAEEQDRLDGASLSPRRSRGISPTQRDAAAMIRRSLGRSILDLSGGQY
jgi:hypothetical protein